MGPSHRSSRRDDDFADYLAILDEAQGLAGLGERQDAIDDRVELVAVDQSKERLDVLAHPAVRAQDLQLIGPDVADVGLGVEAGGGAAGEEAARRGGGT